ncbi:MAG: helix-turn-helix transcriptional regulator [Oscillospiraceae bacterium]|nr:helix-turn-helix transcriptional regulator [Oscillospiraceae bacterium]
MAKITVGEKFRIIMSRRDINMTKLAELTGQSRQNLSNKFARGNFTEDDIEKIAQAMGCEVDFRFILPDGTEV